MALSNFEKPRKEFMDLNLINKATAETFEEFTKYIMQKNTRLITCKFLSSLAVTTNEREFLSCFVLAYYPNESLASERNELEEFVFQKATMVVNSLLASPFDDASFSNYCNKYHEIFTIWKNQDKDDLIDLLTKTHNEYQNVSDLLANSESDSEPIESNEFLESNKVNIKETLNNIETIAYQLGGNNVREQVKTPSTGELIDPNILATKIAGGMHQVFWDIFTNELTENPPNFKQYPILVLEIRKRLESILEKRNTTEILNYINSNLNDIEITEKIKANSYSLQEIYNLCIFCLERVKELGAPADESLVQSYIDRVHTEMNQTPVKIHEIIPNTFKVVLERLYHIGFIRDTLFDSIANNTSNST